MYTNNEFLIAVLLQNTARFVIISGSKIFYRLAYNILCISTIDFYLCFMVYSMSYITGQAGFFYRIFWNSNPGII